MRQRKSKKRVLGETVYVSNMHFDLNKGKANIANQGRSQTGWKRVDFGKT